jgi:hypothetical protein
MSIASTLNFSASTPAAPSGQQLVVPQNDGGSPTCNESFYDPLMTGDTGSGGLAGNVPAPPAGSAAAGKFLKASGLWVVPPGSSITEVAIAPSSPGDFTVAHGLGAAPTTVLIAMTSGGQVWFQTTRFDATNLYLVASDAGLTGFAVCFH